MLDILGEIAKIGKKIFYTISNREFVEYELRNSSFANASFFLWKFFKTL